MARITISRLAPKQYGEEKKEYVELAGKSTEVKPTSDQWVTGSLFTEIDTGDVYIYDETEATWNLFVSLGGGA